jgi:hypothetical protein
MTMTLRRRTKRKRTKRKSDFLFGGLQVEPPPVSGEAPRPNQVGTFSVKVEPAHGLELFRHLSPPIGHHIGMWRMTLLLALAWSSGVVSAPASPGSAQSSSNSHTHDFVIFATVFTAQGFALPGARVRVRRADEKKFRWEGVSDRQGEVGIRVKQDAEYEVIIEARGFKPQTRKVDAREGDREDLTLQMEPLAGGKS